MDNFVSVQINQSVTLWIFAVAKNFIAHSLSFFVKLPPLCVGDMTVGCTPKYLETTDVGFVAIPLFKGCKLLFVSRCGSAIPEIGSSCYCFSPQFLW